MNKPLRVLVVGLGNMGASHARAYHKLDGFELAGLCARSIANRTDLPEAWAAVPRYADYGTALAELKPDVVSINTWPDTHADRSRSRRWRPARMCSSKSRSPRRWRRRRPWSTRRCNTGNKLVVGYILRVHPSWTKFIEIARKLGKPLVMRMNLNQQSVGPAWNWHRNLMESMTPIVDCGVHYVDVMCQMTQSRPVRVHGIGAKLSDQVKVDNYGHLHVEFEDGSVGWYEAGWGPMMSEVAFFVKDVWGPKGAVSIVVAEQGAAAAAAAEATTSSDMDTHVKTSTIRVHHGALNPDNSLKYPDEVFRMDDEPGHDELCEREQLFLLNAIRGNVDLTDHMNDAVNSLRIVLAADESIRTKQVVTL